MVLARYVEKNELVARAKGPCQLTSLALFFFFLKKSTLLRAMATRELPVPMHLNMLYVEQEVAADDTRVIDSVLAADIERLELLAEERAIMSGASPAAAGDASSSSSSSSSSSDSTPADADRLTAVHRRLQEIESDLAEPRAASILAGLGFDATMQQRATSEFSGGWRMRIALARALFCQPDLLLLDEPTNMLDISSVIWLEEYLASWPRTLFIVSHDRNFMNSVATDIVHFHGGVLTPFRGDYDQFEKSRTEKLLNQKRAHEAQERHRKHIKAFVDKFRFNAKRASLVQSRIKMLNKMQLVSAVLEDPTIQFDFPEPEPIDGAALRFDDVSFRYSDGQPLLFEHLDFTINWQDRIALVGQNGAGKSTVLKLCAEQLERSSGAVICNLNCRTAVFSQHHVDQLDLTASSLEFIMSEFPGHDQQLYRSTLARYGIGGDLALNPIATLSGGQKSRVVFAIIAMRRPHFLLLDEPTNHLDLETVDVLAQALNRFSGGVLLVSHDERLITAVCNDLWVCENRNIKVWHESFDDYKKYLAKEFADKLPTLEARDRELNN
jgi:ATP-binding cassette, subfamily F, member 3